MEMKQLTVYHYGDTSEEDRRVTLSLHMIVGLSAKTEDTVLNGRSLREVSVLLVEGEKEELLINHQDLESLELAVGSYCLE